MKFLDEGAVRELLDMRDLIPSMARALADLSGGRAVQPYVPCYQWPSIKVSSV